jgi:hypothetical protein
MSARTVLSFSRDLECASPTELSKRMGCPRYYWVRAAVKELIDNSLDACEEAGIAPEVTIAIEGSTTSVADNGPGMTRELVDKLCVRSQRTSTREAFASPDRGSQGNALPVIMALAFGFGRDRSGMTITSKGLEHTITLHVNRLEQRIDLERAIRDVPTKPGTTITLSWPEEIDAGEIRDLLASYCWLNPHAIFRFNDEPAWSAGTAVAKWPTGAPTPPHWYTPERFVHRVLLEIKRDPALTVAQFLTAFRGLSSSTKRSEVAADVELSYQPLSALLDSSGTSLDYDRARRLLLAMRLASRPPKHAVLGGVGKETVAQWAAKHASREPPLFAYTTVEGVVHDDIPWRVELGFAHLGNGSRQLMIGQNFSPALEPVEMLGAVLPNLAWWFGSNEPIGLFVHRITPSRQTLDYGKSKLSIGWSETAEVRCALDRIAKPWIKYRQAQERGKKPRLPDEPQPERVTFQDAAFQVMAAAYATASTEGTYPVLSQQIFYAARPKILEMTGKDELRPGERSRFCYVLLPQFIRQYAEITAGWRILYKPRGELIEPHTDRRVGLGTSEVATYRSGWTNGLLLGDIDVGEWEPFTSGPHNRFGGVIVVEKGGIADVLRQVGLDRKHDVAIVGNEGQSVEAELKLVDACGRAAVPVFLLTDFDRQGFTIAENLRAGTWRHRYATPPKVVHIGLRLEQINDLGGLASEQDEGGLEDEPIGENALKHVSDDRLRECGATEAEIEVLHDRRVELNALSTEQLVDLVEGALAEHGIVKVIPKTEDLAAAWRAAKAHAEIVKVLEKANRRAAKRWQKAPTPDDLGNQVRKLIKAEPILSWDAALLRIIAEQS